MQQNTMTLTDFNEQILIPSLLNYIKSGALDHAIQSEDCQDIINSDPELRKAVDARLETLKCDK